MSKISDTILVNLFAENMSGDMKSIFPLKVGGGLWHTRTLSRQEWRLRCLLGRPSFGHPLVLSTQTHAHQTLTHQTQQKHAVDCHRLKNTRTMRCAVTNNDDVIDVHKLYRLLLVRHLRTGKKPTGEKFW